MTIEIIWQIWREYSKTRDQRLLIDAVRYADFGDNEEIKEEICNILLKNVGKRSEYGLKIRNHNILALHQINLASGNNITKSYMKIASMLHMSEDAVRKVVEKSAEKHD